MQIKRIVFTALILWLALPLWANDSALRNGHPDTYTVQKGDTLWDISERFLSDPWFWPEIWYVNPEIANPHLIYPGDVISLVYIDGKPRLTVKTDDRVGGTVKLSPRVREQPIESAIPTIPLGAILPFLNRTQIVQPGELDSMPYVIAGEEDRVMSSDGEKMYARGLDGVANGTGFLVVREGDVFVDPDSGETLGIEATDLGAATLTLEGDPARLNVTRSRREILKGDRLLETPEQAFDANFFPKAPDDDVEGKIIAVLDGVSQIGQYSIVVLNLGERENMQVGDVLEVFRTGRVVKDPYAEKRGEMVQLPEEKAGELIVFRTFEKLSFGLIMEAELALLVGDKVASP